MAHGCAPGWPPRAHGGRATRGGQARREEREGARPIDGRPPSARPCTLYSVFKRKNMRGHRWAACKYPFLPHGSRSASPQRGAAWSVSVAPNPNPSGPASPRDTRWCRGVLKTPPQLLSALAPLAVDAAGGRSAGTAVLLGGSSVGAEASKGTTPGFRPRGADGVRRSTACSGVLSSTSATGPFPRGSSPRAAPPRPCMPPAVAAVRFTGRCEARARGGSLALTTLGPVRRVPAERAVAGVARATPARRSLAASPLLHGSTQQSSAGAAEDDVLASARTSVCRRQERVLVRLAG